ncbi:phosphomannomutase [Solibacillus silvestris StLB046]|uniref:Phosphomannomutase n=1 Tax=Solibacillus silvestris (strain StLB046) TaxID=1002809 RepID=F2F581_SOLSS|nr:phosphomannomutase [Solibacillus silvestris StLB046]
MCGLFLLEKLSGILEKVLSILANAKGILEQSEHFLEHYSFVRTNKNILEHFHLY